MSFPRTLEHSTGPCGDECDQAESSGAPPLRALCLGCSNPSICPPGVRARWAPSGHSMRQRNEIQASGGPADSRDVVDRRRLGSQLR